MSDESKTSSSATDSCPICFLDSNIRMFPASTILRTSRFRLRQPKVRTTGKDQPTKRCGSATGNETGELSHVTHFARPGLSRVKAAAARPRCASLVLAVIGAALDATTTSGNPPSYRGNVEVCANPLHPSVEIFKTAITRSYQGWDGKVLDRFEPRDYAGFEMVPCSG